MLNTIETLIKEKNDLLSSHNNSRDLIVELELKLDQERKLVEVEKENSAHLQQILSDQNKQCSVREDELKNTVSILIEEKNELAVGFTLSQEKLKKSEEEKVSLKNELEDTKASLSSLQCSNTEEFNGLQSKIASLTNELYSANQELNLKNQLYIEANEELKQIQTSSTNQATELNQKDAIIKELNLQLELLTVNMQQVKLLFTPSQVSHYDVYSRILSVEKCWPTNRGSKP